MKIETKEEYNKICAEVSDMFDEKFEVDSDRAKLFLEKCKAIEEYDDIHYQFPEPTQEMIDEFRKDQML